jgi:MFS transporter, PAT family, solute carrier family 33 (acetyl-CoA transportor), member 1
MLNLHRMKILIQHSYSVSNLGGTFPRYFVLRLVDAFTAATCFPPQDPYSDPLKGPLITEKFSCAVQADKEKCLAGGGTCEMSRDGYYIVNVMCIIFGAITFVWFIRPRVLQLQSLPLRAWRLATGR